MFRLSLDAAQITKLKIKDELKRISETLLMVVWCLRITGRQIFRAKVQTKTQTESLTFMVKPINN